MTMDDDICAELLKTSGSFASLVRAASVVRQHAIATLEVSSIRLVRQLREAETPAEAQLALESLRKWIAAVGGKPVLGQSGSGESRPALKRAG